jgi:hypothetical protein
MSDVTERKRYTLPRPVSIRPGDKFICEVDGERICEEIIKEARCIDTVVTFYSENFMGLERGIGAVFGYEHQ